MSSLNLHVNTGLAEPLSQCYAGRSLIFLVTRESELSKTTRNQITRPLNWRGTFPRTGTQTRIGKVFHINLPSASNFGHQEVRRS
jgi:hypothetical protein